MGVVRRDAKRIACRVSEFKHATFMAERRFPFTAAAEMENGLHRPTVFYDRGARRSQRMTKMHQGDIRGGSGCLGITLAMPFCTTNFC